MSLTIGIDVGGTKVLGGVVDEAGKVLTTARKDTPRQGGSALTQTIADVARELLDSAISSGADCVKFQIYEAKSLVNGFINKDRFEHFKRFELVSDGICDA